MKKETFIPLALCALLTGCFETPIEKTDKAISLYRPDTTAAQQLQEAHALLESAAEDKEPRAQYMLAKMYERGDGVAQDYNKAFALYTQSSLNGNGDASYMLSRYVEDAQFGQKVDVQQAKNFLEKGASQGSYTAKLLLGLALLNGNPPFRQDVDQGERLLLEVAEKDPVEGHRLHANLGLANLYADPTLGKLAPEKVVTAYEYLAQHGPYGYPPILMGLFDGHIPALADEARRRAVFEQYAESNARVKLLYLAGAIGDGEGTLISEADYRALLAETSAKGDRLASELGCRLFAPPLKRKMGRGDPAQAEQVLAWCDADARTGSAFGQSNATALNLLKRDFKQTFIWASVALADGNQDGKTALMLLAGAGYSPSEAEMNDLVQQAKTLRSDIKTAQANYRDKSLDLPLVERPWY
ncbi:tetratricopeptide repeat protein [Pseudomonas otitidis]|uniref:Tetratricopeptide repeat protein n=1 Tax=Metapseudomonas otitidis TaxID=319939 RepID=A0ABU3XRD4_9GAMM|nr:tetratricopeptide repeat protein [Pseudomonas otitidis]MDV3440375.1 tetratricopeptide repeat protein [Pseudomonas otitidis]WMR33220.1 tetratricopeptide repeat protein [Pseudomonas otitidis]